MLVPGTGEINLIFNYNYKSCFDRDNRFIVLVFTLTWYQKIIKGGIKNEISCTCC